MLGIVLCGGQSQRMGADKGMMMHGEKCWAQIAADKLSQLNILVKISVSEQQLSAYSKVFSEIDFIVDGDSLSIKGPLLGLLSCHVAYPKEDLFVLACDLLLMETSMLATLIDNYRKENSGSYIFTNNGEAEPLCGIYTSKAISHILDIHKKEKLHKHSMKFLLEQLNVCKIALTGEQKKFFQNFNTPYEITF